MSWPNPTITAVLAILYQPTQQCFIVKKEVDTIVRNDLKICNAENSFDGSFV